MNFAISTNMYVWTYRCVTKSDKMPFIGSVLKKNPDLEIISTTYSRDILTNAAFRKNHLQLNIDSHQIKKPKPEKFLKRDVALFFVNNNIKDGLQLIEATTDHRDLGNCPFYDFLIVLCLQVCQEPEAATRGVL